MLSQSSQQKTQLVAVGGFGQRVGNTNIVTLLRRLVNKCYCLARTGTRETRLRAAISTPATIVSAPKATMIVALTPVLANPESDDV